MFNIACHRVDLSSSETYPRRRGEEAVAVGWIATADLSLIEHSEMLISCLCLLQSSDRVDDDAATREHQPALVVQPAVSSRSF